MCTHTSHSAQTHLPTSFLHIHNTILFQCFNSTFICNSQVGWWVCGWSVTHTHYTYVRRVITCPRVVAGHMTSTGSYCTIVCLFWGMYGTCVYVCMYITLSCYTTLHHVIGTDFSKWRYLWYTHICTYVHGQRSHAGGEDAYPRGIH